ncbi:peptide ABC transporter substrate-binding protein [Salipaludibacillus keqinensis]|uniref:Peptide ABC transporter substrate-binding protein n=1 Tax=Salipaludibacillus keqinensis TaxID=2045207 RepID=A0A323TC97_9BACI|nr:oligopeptide/dipeptide ABC transporter ATP-binding protein [Salipaludibacillus keqinensis]PYZ92731.1 peptide ABC transporter substrate-binding protein [Salipaludibacillus keqinensis]
MNKVKTETNNPRKAEVEQPLLEIRGLKKHFDVTGGWFKKNKEYLRAVDGIDLKVKRGETLGIVGESGCGKSTTGNLIVRLLEPTEGEIIFEGENLAELTGEELRQKRKDIQMIFQDPFSSLNPRMRVFELIAEPLRTHQTHKGDELKKRVFELMDVVGLSPEFAQRFPHEFSGGQRQRIGIARALALNPKLLVCDEPVSALDVSIQSQILNLLKRLQEQFNLTLVFIAHGLPAVKHISDRIAVMYLGKVVELTTREKLFAHPMHPYTEGLLTAVPVPDPEVRDTRERVVLKGDIPSPVNPPSGCSFHTRCPFADEKCKQDTPEFKELKPDHFVACHYPLEGGKGTIQNPS